MQFRYFLGPKADMSYLCEDETICSLCGAAGPCFELESAICSEFTDEQKEESFGCFECLQTGRFGFRHDTEAGYLDEDGLRTGHALHKSASVSETATRELLRTPQFDTWQEEFWLAHCGDFMAYLGNWEPVDFYTNAQDGDGRKLFLEMTDPELAHLWDDSLPEGEEKLEEWYASYYAFRCLHCGKLRGNWDCD